MVMEVGEGIAGRGAGVRETGEEGPGKSGADAEGTSLEPGAALRGGVEGRESPGTRKGWGVAVGEGRALELGGAVGAAMGVGVPGPVSVGVMAAQ